MKNFFYRLVNIVFVLTLIISLTFLYGKTKIPVYITRHDSGMVFHKDWKHLFFFTEKHYNTSIRGASFVEIPKNIDTGTLAGEPFYNSKTEKVEEKKGVNRIYISCKLLLQEAEKNPSKYDNPDNIIKLKKRKKSVNFWFFISIGNILILLGSLFYTKYHRRKKST